MKNPGALDAFDQNLGIAIGKLEGLDDVGDRSNLVDLRWLGIVDRGVVLRRQENPLVAFQGSFKSVHRALAADHKRNHHKGEDYDVPYGYHRQLRLLVLFFCAHKKGT